MTPTPSPNTILLRPSSPRPAHQVTTSSVPQISLHRSQKIVVHFSNITPIGNEPDSEESWIEWFCNKRGHEIYLEVDPAFITDEFNLTDLEVHFTLYK